MRGGDRKDEGLINEQIPAEQGKYQKGETDFD
jgi:hypothetical protein